MDLKEGKQGHGSMSYKELKKNPWTSNKTQFDPYKVRFLCRLLFLTIFLFDDKNVLMSAYTLIKINHLFQKERLVRDSTNLLRVVSKNTRKHQAVIVPFFLLKRRGFEIELMQIFKLPT